MTLFDTVQTMSFVKLDCGFLDSTLWIDREARELFITALLMAVPVELKMPMEQIQVQSLEKTGFCVPPGWYGMVCAAGPGIVNRSGMDMVAGIAALERLGAPELQSRSPDFEGRRLVRVDGGYIALNFQKYRDKDHTSAERSRRYRQRNAPKARKTKAQVRAQNDANCREFVAAEARGDRAGMDTAAERGLPDANGAS